MPADLETEVKEVLDRMQELTSNERDAVRRFLNVFFMELAGTDFTIPQAAAQIAQQTRRIADSYRLPLHIAEAIPGAIRGPIEHPTPLQVNTSFR
ncbi:MAG TPA: hypothetical protein VFG51_03525 [Candidatus Saccharimonadia bacterium]|nr:hypothetical protein [Candidatus Saccharimonadia bacterium]